MNAKPEKKGRRRINGLAGITALAALLAAGTAVADHEQRRYARAGNYQSYDYARVVDVQPIVRYVTVETPVRECWQETRYRDYDHHGRGAFSRSAGSSIAGAIIGGVIGHQFGSGRGNDAATVAGSLIGAAIGSERGAERDRARSYSTESYPVERCDVRYETRTEERVDGYRVTYVYNGQRLRTRMNHDPGDRIRVQVNVRPTSSGRYDD